MRSLRDLIKDRETNNTRGAAAVMVGAALVAIIGATGLAVDMGNLQASRNRAGTAADAAALAAAQELSDGESTATACALAASQVTANEPDATLVSCVAGTSSNGQTIVTVEVNEQVDYFFANAVGFTSNTITRTSSARYGLRGVTGLRPFGLCIETLHSMVGTWSPSDGTSLGPIQLPFNPSQPADCNGSNSVPGNWGSLDFDGGSNDTPSQIDWIENGYDGTIYAGQDVEGNTGAPGNSVSGALTSLIGAGEFQVPIFNSVSGTGANALFTVVGFLTVELTGYQVTGNPNNRHIEFIFKPGTWPGVECCDPANPLVAVNATGLCAHSEDTDAC